MIESGKLWVLVGASRSGKTERAKAELVRHKCVLVWDIEGKYDCTLRVRSQAALIKAVKALAGKKAVIAFTGKLTDFDYFCRCAFVYVQLCEQVGKRSAVVFEETADVTTPGKAPEGYGILLRRGLKYGADLFAITQRPAESDKTSIGNSSVLHICRMATPRDREYMAKASGVPLTVLQGLRANQDAGAFDFVTVDTGRGEWRRGCLTFPRGKAKFSLQGEVNKI